MYRLKILLLGAMMSIGMVKAFDETDKAFYYNLVYLESISAITTEEMDTAILYLEEYRKAGLCIPDEECRDLSDYVINVIHGEKNMVNGIIGETFPEIGKAERSIGRAIRRSVENFGTRKSSAARRRMERRFKKPRRKPHNSTRLGPGSRRA